MAASPSRPRAFVQSLARGLAVITALSSPAPGRTLSQVAHATGLTRASARRFLLTLETAGLDALTAATTTDPQRLRRHVTRARAQGWALVDQELEDGLRSVAVPIRNPGGEVVAAMNLSTHASRRPPQQIRDELLPPLRETADRIEGDLASVPPAHTASRAAT